MTTTDPRAKSPTPAMGGVARGSSANLLGAVVMSASTFAVTVVVTRGISLEAAGIFFAATSLFLLATAVGQLGTSTALVYFVSRARSLGRDALIGSYYRTAMRPVLVTGVAMGVAMFVLSEQLAGLVTPDNVAETASYLRVMAFLVPLAGAENVTLAATRGLGTMRPNVVVEQLMRPAMQLVCVATVVLLVPTSGALAWAWSGPYLPAAIAGYAYWRRLARRALARSQTEGRAGTGKGDSVPMPPITREFWCFTAPRAFASVGQMAMQRLDILLVAALAGPAQAAVYAAATRFLVVGQMGARAISLAVQPRLGASLARNLVDDTNHYYRMSTSWLILVTWPLYLTFIVFGSVLLGVFGSGYETGVLVLLVLSCAMLIATGCGMVDMVLNMAGRTSWNLYNVLLSVGIQFTLCVVLIPRLGILGAAIAWAAAIATSNVVPLLQIGLTMRLHPFGLAPVIAVTLALVCFGGTGIMCRQLGGLSAQALAVSLLVGVPLYVFGLWIFRRPLELAALRTIRRGRRTNSHVLTGSMSD